MGKKKKKKLRKLIGEMINDNYNYPSYPPVVIVKGFRYNSNDGKDNQKK